MKNEKEIDGDKTLYPTLSNNPVSSDDLEEVNAFFPWTNT